MREAVQLSALNADGCRAITQDRDALERLVRRGTVVKVRHLFLLADPKARRRPGGWRKDLLACIGRLEKAGAVIKDVEMQLTTAKPDHRADMLAVALDQLANNGRTIHLLKRRQGRRKRVFPREVEAAVEKIWINTRDYPTDEAAMEAIAKIDKTYSRERARREYKARYRRA